MTFFPRSNTGLIPSPLQPSYERYWFGDVKIYLVGGAVREIVRGFPEKVKDWDFAVEARDYDTMAAWIKYQGFEIFLETPQYFTIRARASEKFVFAGRDMSGRTFDFTLCRSDGDYSDGRRPDSVKVGTLQQDLSRRDFTMNAMAMASDGKIIDPFGGQKDIEQKLIRLVGGTARLKEDSLRMLRAIRFAIQLDFDMHNDVYGFLLNSGNSDLLKNVDQNRIRDELTKCFKIDTRETLWMLHSFHSITEYIFQGDLWLMPTSKSK